MAGHTHRLRLRAAVLELGVDPLLMGILNATPDSFSDTSAERDPETRAARGLALVEAGAAIVDVGGESGITNRSPVEPAAEIARVVPLIEHLAAGGALISVDTYKPAVARAAIAAGASMVNDPSGLVQPEVAEICAGTGAALVVTHTRARPKQKLDRPRYDDIVDDVKQLLDERLEVARSLGVSDQQLVVCPGPDLGKDPAHTVALLRRLPEIAALGFPLLLAASRKDFIGALTGAPPRRRLAGTLAAIEHGVRSGADLLRVHDVAAVRDFLAVRAALAGEAEVSADLRLADDLRREPPAAGREAAA